MRWIRSLLFTRVAFECRAPRSRQPRRAFADGFGAGGGWGPPARPIRADDFAPPLRPPGFEIADFAPFLRIAGAPSERPVSARLRPNQATKPGHEFGLAERRRSRTYQPWGYHGLPVLKIRLLWLNKAIQIVSAPPTAPPVWPPVQPVGGADEDMTRNSSVPPCHFGSDEACRVDVNGVARQEQLISIVEVSSIA